MWHLNVSFKFKVDKNIKSAIVKMGQDLLEKT